VLIHTTAAAHVCMGMRMNSNLRSVGKQTNKCSFRLRYCSNLLHTNAPLCSLCVSQRLLLQLGFASLLFLPTQRASFIYKCLQRHIQPIDVSHLGSGALSRLSASPGQLNNFFRDFCQIHDSDRSLSPAATLSCGMAAHGEPAELPASKYDAPPELHSHILQEQCVVSAFHRISFFSGEDVFRLLVEEKG